VWSRTSVSPGNTITVQSASVAHGAWAARFHAVGGTSIAMMFDDAVPPALEKHYFGRMYYFATGFPSESGGHSAYITASNGATGFPYHDHHLEVGSFLDTKGPIWQLTYWTGDGPEYIGAGGSIPKAKWFCLEWEFNDSPDLRLQGGGDALVQAVAAANPNTVVVLQTGSAVEMPWASTVRAIVENWYGGEQMGPALANLISISIYNIVRITFLWKKFRLFPFTRHTLYTILFAAACFGACYFAFMEMHGLAGLILRSLAFIILYTFGATYFNLSPDIKPVLSSILSRLGMRKTQ